MLQKTRVVVAGLDLDFQRQPFGPTLSLIKVAKQEGGRITQHYAHCDGCKGEAPFSYRKRNKPGQVIVGGAELYGACCDNCYNRLHAK